MAAKPPGTAPGPAPRPPLGRNGVPDKNAPPKNAPPSLGSQFRSPRFWVTLLILLVANVLISNLLFQPSQPKSVNISYTEFKRQVTDGNVSSITAIGNSVTGSTHQAVKDINGKDSATHFATAVPVYAGSGLEAMLDSHDVIQYARPATDQTPLWLTLLFNAGPTILLVALFLYISRRASMGSGGILGQFGQSRARLFDQERPTTTFADVAGIDEVKAELQEVVDFLREPTKYQRLGGTMPKGVLLVGPPGTGKTLLARAVAGEAGVPFFSQSASEFVEMFVGVGASRVRSLFEEAKKHSPAVVFVDELDAVGRQRGAGLGGGHDEREQTLNQLLVEMDGF